MTRSTCQQRRSSIPPRLTWSSARLYVAGRTDAAGTRRRERLSQGATVVRGRCHAFGSKGVPPSVVKVPSAVGKGLAPWARKGPHLRGQRCQTFSAGSWHLFFGRGDTFWPKGAIPLGCPRSYTFAGRGCGELENANSKLKIGHPRAGRRAMANFQFPVRSPLEGAGATRMSPLPRFRPQSGFGADGRCASGPCSCRRGGGLHAGTGPARGRDRGT